LSTGEFTKVASTDEIPSGRMKLVDVGGVPVAVANAGGTFYAFSNECTHDGGPLSEGELDGECVTCPWHFSRYRMTNGQVVRGPSVYDQPAYEVRPKEGGGWEARKRPTG